MSQPTERCPHCGIEYPFMHRDSCPNRGREPDARPTREKALDSAENAPRPTPEHDTVHCPFCDSGLTLSEKEVDAMVDLSRRLEVSPDRVWHMALAAFQLQILGVPDVGQKSAEVGDAPVAQPPSENGSLCTCPGPCFVHAPAAPSPAEHMTDRPLGEYEREAREFREKASWHGLVPWTDAMVAEFVAQRDQEHARLLEALLDFEKRVMALGIEVDLDDQARMKSVRNAKADRISARLSELLQAAKERRPWEHASGCATRTAVWDTGDHLWKTPHKCDCGLPALRTVIEKIEKER